MTQTKLKGLPLLACVLLALPACANNKGDEAAKGKDGDAAKTDAVAAPEAEGPIAGAPVEGEQKVAEKPGASPEDKAYTLQIEPSEGKVGEEGQVSIRVIPAETWHMNLEYPTKLQVEPPAGVTVAKAKLGKDDAVELDEENCEFALSFTPSEAGDKTFTGEFKFAVCQDEACAPKTEKLEFTVAVK
ncbi:hypothetical protein G6O69_30845 [Pseudenhygromyxa sp. WMMC2535]|uniref:protein-disulfide reductase DsbD family protein n=1 Tax=Pseudenhygromyxa sp. WMMC2535 TaxID=2712867 RepID=UPI001556DFCD|nr:protein-disulfide reductase DsbD family protein [Pseudenhygromyxa sp. WMMC2535]NVB42262.1 hypothetical protein [Pseudenhygromyxa sp. WMMC2535]